MMIIKIGIIGPGEFACSRELYNFGVDLGGRIADSKRIIVCGGLGGFMEAVCRGVKQWAGTFSGQTIGIIPGEDACAANPYIDVAIPTGMGIARNILIINTADILIAAGGGAGTLSELAFAWQKNKKVLCVTTYGGWARELAGNDLDERAKNLLVAVKSVEDIMQYLQ